MRLNGKRQKQIFLFSLLFFYFLYPRISTARDFASVWGKVIDLSGYPLDGVRITLTESLKGERRQVRTDSHGEYFFININGGSYRIQFGKESYRTHFIKDVILQPLQTLQISVTLAPDSSEVLSSSRVIRLDFTNNLHQTHLNANQINQTPAAHNVWSLIENQDLSATTNRIDVGGLWGLQPALFSSRGSCSWTQNVYLLNGFDVSDPFWGGLPLFFADFYSLEQTQLINAGNPPFALSPGASYNLTTKEGTDTYSGSVSTSFIRPILQSSNITPHLEGEGIFESHTFDHYSDGNIQLSGPIAPGRVNFYVSASSYSIGRNIADFDHQDDHSALSGLFCLNYKNKNSILKVLWTGQSLSYSMYGAGRDVALSATSDRHDSFEVIQTVWEKQISDRHVILAGLNLAFGSSRSAFQRGDLSPHAEDIFTGIGTGSAPFETESSRHLLNFQVRGESFVPQSSGIVHKLQYGFQLKSGGASTRMDAIAGYHIYTFNDRPIQVAFLNTPVRHRESSFDLSFYLQDSLIFPSFHSLYFGIHVDAIRGNAVEGDKTSDIPHDPASSIGWISLSPRLGFVFPLSSKKNSAVKLSVARYFHTLPLNYLSYGNPGSLASDVYRWEDPSGDGLFQEEERGVLLRKEGPFFTQIDPNLKRTSTDEVCLSFVQTFGRHWRFTFSGFFRKTKNLIETENIGVQTSDYEEVLLNDNGDDRIPGSHDDLQFTIYNQKPSSLGNDSYFLTNAGSDDRRSRYVGLDLTLLRNFGERFTFFLSLQAINTLGIANPGNTEWENDDGVIGSLYDNPNTLINAEGRLRYDRGYTGRLGLTYLAPFGIRTAVIVKYYDGQPFTRKIVITGMNQGPFYVQAHPRGKARYEFNMTIDIRLEKELTFGISRLRIFLDGFNIANMFQATEENEWTGPEFPLRYATEIQSPRVFRLGLSYEF